MNVTLSNNDRRKFLSHLSSRRFFLVVNFSVPPGIFLATSTWARISAGITSPFGTLNWVALNRVNSALNRVVEAINVPLDAKTKGLASLITRGIDPNSPYNSKSAAVASSFSLTSSSLKRTFFSISSFEELYIKCVRTCFNFLINCSIIILDFNNIKSIIPPSFWHITWISTSDRYDVLSTSFLELNLRTLTTPSNWHRVISSTFQPWRPSYYISNDPYCFSEYF